MRRLAPRTRERSQQLLSALCYTRPPYWAHPAKCRTRSSRASLARRSTSISVSLSPARTPHPRASMIRRLLRAQLAGKRAPTPCHDTGLAGGSHQADPSRTRVFCTAYMRSIEGSAPPTTHPPRHRPQTPSGEPPNRLHATGADRRTSLTSACFSVCLA